MKTLTLSCNKCSVSLGGSVSFDDSIPDEVLAEKAKSYLCQTCAALSSDEETERKKYENKYLEATKQLVLLSGGTVEEGTWPKLEDYDFETIGMQACVNNPGVGAFLMTSLEYTLRTLKYDFSWPWEQIEYRPEVVE